MATKKKILLFGNEPTNFTSPIANELRKTNNFEIDVLDILNDRAKPIELIAPNYDKVLPKPPSTNLNNYSFLQKIRSFLKPSFWNFFFENFKLYFCFLKHSFLAVIKEAMRYAILKRKIEEIFAPYDVINFHLLSSNCLYYMNFVPKGKKIIVSFWGSDLSKNDAQYNYHIQQKAFEKADVITMGTIEMQEIFLAKFGRHLKYKTRVALVGCDAKTLEKIESLDKNEIINKFRDEFKVSKEKFIISIGNCARVSENHDKILAELSKLETSVKDKLALILLLGYDRRDPEHLEKINKYVEAIGIQTIKNETFLLAEENAKLRIVADITIRMQEHDALSVTLLENLYAGSIPITASWLHYETIRRNGGFYIDIDSFGMLPAKIKEVIDNFERYKSFCANNKNAVKKIISVENLAIQWGQIYSEVSRKN